MLIATEALGPIRSNIPLVAELALDATTLLADDHTMVDFGDDALHRGPRAPDDRPDACASSTSPGPPPTRRPA